MNGQTTDRQDNTVFLFFAGLIVIFVIIPAGYMAKADVVNGVLLEVAKLELRPFLSFSDEARTAWAHINTLVPAEMDWNEMERVLSYAGKWARWPFLMLLTVMGLVAFFMGRAGGLSRRFSMDTLLRNNSESFACLAPIVGRGKYLLSPESYDKGPWQIARSPVQFALMHNLLVDASGRPYTEDEALQHGIGHTDCPAYGQARFDKAAAREVFQQQLGPRFSSGGDSLSPLRKAVAAAFLAYADGAKKEAVSLLDQMARSYTEPVPGQQKKSKKSEDTPPPTPSCPILEKADFQKSVQALWEKHGGLLSETIIVRHQAFEMPWFMALITRARRKGVLASSQFLFVRPLDRPLWYALNQCGGRAAWAEAFAPWAHFMEEEHVHHVLSEPHVERAVIGLQSALDAQGWLIAASSEAVEPEESADPSSADSDYDANEDPDLQDELF